MAFLEFVIALFAFIVVLILINFGIFIYKLCMYGKNGNWNWGSSERRNSTPMTEVSIPCTISAQVSAAEGLGPDRRLSELIVRDGQLVLINYSTPNGPVVVKKMSMVSSNTPIVQTYEDMPPSYEDVCQQP